MERSSSSLRRDDQALSALLTGPVLGNISRLGRGGSEQPAVLTGGPTTGRATRRKRFPRVDFYGNEIMACGLAGHRHSWPELATVLCGRVHVGIDRRVYEARPGDWLLLRSGVVHGECCLPSGTPYDLFWFVCQHDHLRIHATRYSPANGYEVLCTAEMARPGPALMTELTRLCDEPWKPSTEARQRLLLLVTYILETFQSASRIADITDQPPEPLHRGMQWHPLVAEVRAMVERSVRRPPSLVELANAVGLSPNYLSSLFHQQTGRTLHRFIDEHRIGLAQRLLAGEVIASAPLPPAPASASTRARAKHAPAAGPPSVKAVAYAMGFSDPYHFSKVFRRVTGMSPSAYRNRRLHAGLNGPSHDQRGRKARNA
ncbi:MAG: helix-turn-helix transcriptional regulator [Phycisphaeraceae bacterium]|nr:helix-turn-helix transcriptional regulator [Phycisphaeraceae bacterium]